ncbi:MAG: MarR family transcriptional regulator [Pseudomonadota bacterium]
MTAPPPCSRTPEEQIGYLLKRLMHQFRHQVDERLRRNSDVSFAHLVTLDQLQQEPGIAGARLARRLLVTAQTMTGLLRRLETDGAIERRPDPNNRRADRWYLLPEGVERLKAARAAGAPVMTQMLSLLKSREVAELRGYLERCVEGLETSEARSTP